VTLLCGGRALLGFTLLNALAPPPEPPEPFRKLPLWAPLAILQLDVDVREPARLGRLRVRRPQRRLVLDAEKTQDPLTLAAILIDLHRLLDCRVADGDDLAGIIPEQLRLAADVSNRLPLKLRPRPRQYVTRPRVESQHPVCLV